MDPVRHDPNPALDAHVAESRRVLGLPIDVNGLHWHPFGVFTVPLAKRTDAQGTWSRRLHLWHPGAKPVGEASAYGVHTHSGTARSHVLVGALHHHLYAFEADPEGIWKRAALGVPEGQATLVGHVQATTRVGMTHTLPADHPHGVTKPDGWAISLFEQLDGPARQPFTTWQRTDVPEESLVRKTPVAMGKVAFEALRMLDTVRTSTSRRDDLLQKVSHGVAVP